MWSLGHILAPLVFLIWPRTLSARTCPDHIMLSILVLAFNRGPTVGGGHKRSGWLVAWGALFVWGLSSTPVLSWQIFFLDFALNQIILSLNRVMTGQEKAHPVLLHLLWKYLGQINGIKPWASLSSAPNIRSHTRWLHFIRCVLGFGLLGFWILLQLWSMQSYKTF